MWPFTRKPAPLGLDTPFTPGSAPRFVGGLWIHAEGGHIVISDVFDADRIAPEALPWLGGAIEMRRVARVPSEEGLVLIVSAWSGITLESPGSIAWSEGAAALVPSGIPGAPARPVPSVIVKGRYALLSADLEAAAVVHRDLHVFIRYPGGEITGGSLQSLQRARFTADTGIHPSYATDADPPDGYTPPKWLVGRFSADLGPVLEPPVAPIRLRVGAAMGLYRADEIELTLTP